MLPNVCYPAKHYNIAFILSCCSLTPTKKQQHNCGDAERRRSTLQLEKSILSPFWESFGLNSGTNSGEDEFDSGISLKMPSVALFQQLLDTAMMEDENKATTEVYDENMKETYKRFIFWIQYEELVSRPCAFLMPQLLLHRRFGVPFCS